MKKLALGLILGLGLLQVNAAELSWHTGQQFDKALDKAKAENKMILIDFTGSDW